MSLVKLEEHIGVIIRTDPFFEPSDTTPRIRVDFIDKDNKRIYFECACYEFERLLDFLSNENKKASKREYIH